MKPDFHCDQCKGTGWTFDQDARPDVLRCHCFCDCLLTCSDLCQGECGCGSCHTWATIYQEAR